MTPSDMDKLRELIKIRDEAELAFETKGAAAHYVEAVDASKALKDWLGSKAVAILEHIERVERSQNQLIDVMASLAAAISLLERGGKKAAGSDKMFEQMLCDYRASLQRARQSLEG